MQNHIRIPKFLNNRVNTQALIYLIQNFVSNTNPVSKNLTEYNNNNSEENEEEKETIDIDFIEQKADTENDENAIDFK